MKSIFVLWHNIVININNLVFITLSEHEPPFVNTFVKLGQRHRIECSHRPAALSFNNILVICKS